MILLYLLLVIILIFVTFNIWQSIRKKIWVIYKIPGPPSKPVFGNFLDLTCSQENLWNFFRKCSKEYYPIYKLTAFHKSCVCLLTADDIGNVLSSSQNINKGPLLYFPLHNWLQDGLLTSSGEKWQTRRKIITPTFHFNILSNFAQVFLKNTEELVKKLEKECEKNETNIVSYISESMLESVVETAMGIRLEEVTSNPREYINSVLRIGEIVTYRATHTFISSNILYMLSPTYLKEKRELKALHGLSKSVMKKRIDELNAVAEETNNLENGFGLKKRSALLDLLIQKMNNKEIDEAGIQEEVDTFMFEGHDTTSVSLCYTLLLLACYPSVQEKARKEIKEILGENADQKPTFQEIQSLSYLEMVIKESLRLYPSVPLISRKLSKDMTSEAGYLIPRGVEVFLHIHDLHRDPTIWRNPNEFDPNRFLPENIKERKPFAYVPFSAGARNCIGQKFAMLEMKIVLVGILRKFSLSAVDTPETVIPVMDLVNRTRDGIKIKLTKLT